MIVAGGEGYFFVKVQPVITSANKVAGMILRDRCVRGMQLVVGGRCEP